MFLQTFKVYELEKYVRVRIVGAAPLTRIPHIKYIFITLTHTETCTIIIQILPSNEANPSTYRHRTIWV